MIGVLTMSSLYRRTDSRFLWWKTNYKGRMVRKSTKMTHRHLAKKVQNLWDLNLILEKIDFLGISQHPSNNIKYYINTYIEFVSKRKSIETTNTAKRVLNKFNEYLDGVNITKLII